jgi:hypothetical protein
MTGSKAVLGLNKLTSSQLLSLSKLGLNYLTVVKYHTTVNKRNYNQIEVSCEYGILARGPVVQVHGDKPKLYGFSTVNENLWDLQLVNPKPNENTLTRVA